MIAVVVTGRSRTARLGLRIAVALAFAVVVLLARAVAAQEPVDEPVTVEIPAEAIGPDTVVWLARLLVSERGWVRLCTAEGRRCREPDGAPAEYAAITLAILNRWEAYREARALCGGLRLEDAIHAYGQRHMLEPRSTRGRWLGELDVDGLEPASWPGVEARWSARTPAWGFALRASEGFLTGGIPLVCTETPDHWDHAPPRPAARAAVEVGRWRVVDCGPFARNAFFVDAVLAARRARRR